MPHMGALLHGLGVWGALAALLLQSPWGLPNLQKQDWARWSAPNAHFPNAPFSGRTLRRFVPVEVQETETAYTLRAEVPGFAKEDIKVVFDPSTQLLTISGERREAHAAGQASSPEAPQGDQQPAADDQQASQWEQRLAAAVQYQQLQQQRLEEQQQAAADNKQPTAQAEQQQQSEQQQQQQAPHMTSHIVFSRSFPVPQDVDMSKQISAKVENGVLQVTLLKVVAPPKPRAQQIPVL